MYSPKRQLRLFRDPAWPSKDDTSRYTYSWTQPTGGPSVRANAMCIDDTGLNGILATANATDGQEGPYITRDGGRTWTLRTTGMSFPALVHANGCAIARSTPNVMYCTTSGNYSGDVYKSTDYGSNWSTITPQSTLRNWNSIACTPTGSIAVAVDFSGTIQRTINGGTTWTSIQPTSNVPWGAVCVSESGNTIVLGVTNGGPIRVTTNGGSTWTSNAATGGAWLGMACSADGSVIFGASVTSTKCFLSTDSGVTWTRPIDLSDSGVGASGYRRTACSVNGNKLAITEGVSTGYIWVSQDRGVTWSRQPDSGNWEGVAMTLNGKTILAGTNTASKPWVGSGV